MSAVATAKSKTNTERLIQESEFLNKVLRELEGLNIRPIQFYSTDSIPEIWVHPSAELTAFKIDKKIIDMKFAGSNQTTAKGFKHKGVLIIWMQLETTPTLATVH